jgi:hypothetical protein
VVNETHKDRGGKTTVVNVRKEPCDVYIGRAMPRWTASPFGNPFRVTGDLSRVAAIAQYREWLLQQPDLLEQLEELRGKRLGCWCKPLACHGDVLVELLEGAPQSAPTQESLF